MLQGREHGDMNAAVWRRVTAAAIDFVIVPSVAMIVMLITGALENAEAWTDGFPWLRVVLLGVVGYLMVNGVLLWRCGQTLGKRLAKIKIVDHESGQVPALWKLIVLRAPFSTYACHVDWLLVSACARPAYGSSRGSTMHPRLGQRYQSSSGSGR